jgi:hypothetical protein
MKLRNYSLVSPFDVIEGTYDRPNCKYATACYKFLKERGLLPLYVDGNFSFLNVLANFAFYSGCVARKDVNISGNEETLERIEKNIMEKLSLKTKIKPTKGNHGSVLSMAEEGGAYMARLLKCMGLPRSCGRKAKAKTLEMPDYRTDLFRLATCDEVLEDEDVAKVKKLERDATAVLFSAKANPDSEIPKQYWVLNFLSRPTPEEARDFAAKNLQLVNFSTPEIGLNESQIRTRRLVSGSHTSYIPISGKVLESILDGSRDLLKFSPRLQRLYNFELAFEPAVL